MPLSGHKALGHFGHLYKVPVLFFRVCFRFIAMKFQFFFGGGSPYAFLK